MTNRQFVPDSSGLDEMFIPMNVSGRSLAILDRAIEAYKTGEIAHVAVRYLVAEGYEIANIEGDEASGE